MRKKGDQPRMLFLKAITALSIEPNPHLIVFRTAVSARTVMDNVEVTELYPLYSGKSPSFELVAVENLSPKRRDSWTYYGDSATTVWLQDERFLGEDFTNIRIFGFSYEITEDSSLQSLASAFLHELLEMRTSADVVIPSS